jgi:hypothetical protein
VTSPGGELHNGVEGKWYNFGRLCENAAVVEPPSPKWHGLLLQMLRGFILGLAKGIQKKIRGGQS